MATKDAKYAVRTREGQGVAGFAAAGVRKIIDGTASPTGETYSGFLVTADAVVDATSASGGDNLSEESFGAGIYFPGPWSSLSLKSGDTGVIWGIISEDAIPALQTATVENGAPADIVLTYDEQLDENSVPSVIDFSATADAAAKTISSVAVSGKVVTVTVSAAFSNGEVILVSYTPGKNPIRDQGANKAAALSDESVTNNVA